MDKEVLSEKSKPISGSYLQQFGLFTPKLIKKGELICKYIGKVRWKFDQDSSSSSDYSWSKSDGFIIDAKDSTSIAKFANHYVHGIFDSNCKLKNIKNEAILIATRDIDPGKELLWNYGSLYWSNPRRQEEKLTRNKLKLLKDNLLWRDCYDDHDVGEISFYKSTMNTLK
jgi:SET domain-containing protein